MDKTMKKISQKYPKAWAHCINSMPDWMKTCIWQNITAESSYLRLLFGYLVLEYFPKHGIVIALNWDSPHKPSCRIWSWEDEDLAQGDDVYDSVEKAISKAFEIREGQIK